MPISDIVNVAITVDTPGVSRAGYGIPLILSPNVAWAERVRSYTSLSGVASDFGATTPEYLAAQSIFSQNPKPTKIMIGRLANKPTVAWKITVSSVLNLTAYSVQIGTQTATYTSDANATNDEIADGLAAAITALGDAGIVAATTGAGGSHVATITGAAAGNWRAVQVADVTRLSLEMNHADPGAAADLTAINLEDGSWYAILNMYNSKLMALAIAAWAEANGKLYLCQAQDTPCEQTAAGGATDILASLKTAAYARTVGFYMRNNGQMLAPGLAGRVLPLDPGSETWKFKTVAGVTPDVYTDTQRVNLKNRNANYYYTVAGVNIVTEGVVADGEFIDVIRFRDWIASHMAEGVFGALASANKVPFTDEGIAIVENEVRGALKDGVAAGGFAKSPAPVVSVPLAADVSSGDKALRKLRTVRWSATLAGAIHAVDPINGTVSF